MSQQHCKRFAYIITSIGTLVAGWLQSVHLSSVLLVSHEGGSGAACRSDRSTVAGTASCTARSSETASAPPAPAAGWVLSASKDSLQQSRHSWQLQCPALAFSTKQ